MIINHNLNSMNAHRNSQLNTTAAGKHMEKLSSGLRINRAGDDAAGLAISEKMRGQIKGLSQAQRNAQDGISYIQTMEGALNEVSDMLTRAKELIVQRDNGVYNYTDVQNINEELDALKTEINNIKDNTKFNGMKMSGDIQVVIDDQGTTIGIGGVSLGTAVGITIGTATASLVTYADGTTANVTVMENATTVGEVNKMIEEVSTARGKLGALQNRLEHTSNNLGTTVENITASESRIRDTDMAKTMSEFSSRNIITQASLSMLAQANQLPQNVLNVLR